MSFFMAFLHSIWSRLNDLQWLGVWHLLRISSDFAMLPNLERRQPTIADDFHFYADVFHFHEFAGKLLNFKFHCSD